MGCHGTQTKRKHRRRRPTKEENYGPQTKAHLEQRGNGGLLLFFLFFFLPAATAALLLLQTKCRNGLSVHAPYEGLGSRHMHSSSYIKLNFKKIRTSLHHAYIHADNFDQVFLQIKQAYECSWNQLSSPPNTRMPCLLEETDNAWSHKLKTFSFSNDKLIA